MILAFMSVLFALHSKAALSIPSGLSVGEQQLITQTLGFGTSFRPVNNPYPLGGYSGFEVGLSGHSIPTSDIGYFGNRATVTSTVLYPMLNVGKGIFDNTDILFSFLPYNESSGFGIYSGALRWTFFQATFVPASFSLLLHGSSINFSNIFNSQTVGLDLITGVNVDPFSFYVGAGTIYGQAQFSNEITSNNVVTNQVMRIFHTLIGLNIDIANFFTAFEIDVYNTTVVSLKMGVRL